MNTTDKREEEIGCWNCALEGIKTGKPVCPDCGTEIAHHCNKYNHKKVEVETQEYENNAD